MFPFWVLFAMPVTRDSFFAEAARSQPSDYMTMTLAGRVPQSVWDERYATIVDAAAGLMRRLHRLDVPFSPAVGLAQLQQATHSARVVVLFAHWRGEHVASDDLLGEPQQLVQRLHDAGFAVCRGAAACVSRQDLVTALNSFIAGTGQAAPMAAARAAAQRRSELDTALTGLLQPGNRLELADGLHSAETIERAIDPAFSGTLDLCTCTSHHLAGRLKARRGDAVSTIYNTQLLDPLPAYLIARTLIEHCVRSGEDYRLVRLQAAAELATLKS